MMLDTYSIVLFLHSWIRWLVVATGLFAVVSAFRARATAREYTSTDNRRGLWFVIALDVQVALGLTLYLFLSPMTRAGFHDWGSAMRSSVLRFFLIEHVVSMTLALVAVHLGRIRTRRASNSRDKHQRSASGALIALLCVLVGIPWPFLPYTRPLARWHAPYGENVESSSTVSSATKDTFQSRCAPCHGVAGRGDGPAAVNLMPRPRDFSDPEWQRGVTDLHIEMVIQRGGLAVGKSVLMPANSDLTDERIRELRQHIRQLSSNRSPNAP